MIDLYYDLRAFIFSLNPEANELLYNTHALVSSYSLSDRMSEMYCMIPIYSKHMNLGFMKGTLLHDPQNLLHGTGKLMRHIPISDPSDYRNEAVEALIISAIELEREEMEAHRKKIGLTISKIKMPS
ncbi:MAG: DUF1801 domain-containing protein [Bacteroidota bacterium]